jgi:hypothetical protein
MEPLLRNAVPPEAILTLEEPRPTSYAFKREPAFKVSNDVFPSAPVTVVTKLPETVVGPV